MNASLRCGHAVSGAIAMTGSWVRRGFEPACSGLPHACPRAARVRRVKKRPETPVGTIGEGLQDRQVILTCPGMRSPRRVDTTGLGPEHRCRRRER